MLIEGVVTLPIIGWVGGDVQGDQHDKLDSRADKVQAKPLQRQR